MDMATKKQKRSIYRYNILDLFAKNFFGIFLSYIIFTFNFLHF
jgi:hypothetical protein